MKERAPRMKVISLLLSFAIVRPPTIGPWSF